MKPTIVNITVLFIFLLFGCANETNKEKQNNQSSIDLELDKSEIKSNKQFPIKSNEDVVFYNMFSPLDMDKIITQKSSYFNSAYINSLNNITKYTNSHKVALNIGVFGADLSYLWIFDQTQQALSYLNAIKHLTNKLGLPDNLVEFTANSAEQNSSQIDSLIIITRKAYHDADVFLKDNNRDNYALLILLGGWVETMHVALHMYNEPDSKLASKIITQKYSLNSLITMVQNCQEDIVLTEYLLLMKKMRDAFKVPESMLKAGDVDIDTVNKQITIKDSENIYIEPQHFSELKTITTQIRNHIIK